LAIADWDWRLRIGIGDWGLGWVVLAIASPGEDQFAPEQPGNGGIIHQDLWL
jgi:hypothetical protein